MFSKTCQYAFQAVIYIAVHGNKDNPVGQIEIADKQKLPKHFLGKILQVLVKNKILGSMKGPNGGFYLAKEPKLISLKEVHDVIDGQEGLLECVMGYQECNSVKPCPMHFAYEEIRRDLIDLLEKRSLEDLMKDIKLKKAFLTV